MATERFPKAKYRRQLAAIEHDLCEWAYGYDRSADEQVYGWLHQRFTQRAAELVAVANELEHARYALDELPRLS